MNTHDAKAPQNDSKASANDLAEAAIAQLARKRQDDKKAAQTKRAGFPAAQPPAQLAVSDDIPANTAIIIDNPAADDFMDTGVVKRHSNNVLLCQAVEFDNEKGPLYRVMNYEMSPLAEAQSDAGRDAVFKATASDGMHEVAITGTFELTSKEMGYTADFVAESASKRVGSLQVAFYPGRGFYLVDIKADGIGGVGTVLLQVAASMALKFGQRLVLLGATMTKKEKGHPGPFYEKFGFKTTEDLSKHGGNLKKFLEANGNKTINMIGSSNEVLGETSHYLHGKGWTITGWQAG